MTVYFTLNTDPDIAQVQVQNRVNLALPTLPSAVQQLGVSVQKKSSSIMMLIAVFAKDNRYSADYIANYANVYVLDALRRVPGAGQAAVLGAADQAMRIWMNPDRMASLGITTTDIQNAVNQQNALVSAGQIGQQPSSGPDPADLSGRHREAVRRALAVRQHHPARESGRWRDRAAQRCSAHRGGSPAVHHRQQIQRHAGHVPRRLPPVRRQRPGRVGGRAQDHGGHESALPARNGLRDLARHQRLRAHLDRRGDPHADRGGRAGRAGRLPVPAELPHDDHLHRGHRGRVDQPHSPACSRWGFRSIC